MTLLVLTTVVHTLLQVPRAVCSCSLIIDMSRRLSSVAFRARHLLVPLNGQLALVSASLNMLVMPSMYVVRVCTEGKDSYYISAYCAVTVDDT